MILSLIGQDKIRRIAKSSQTAAPTVRTESEDLGKGIRQLQEAIQRGSWRLSNLDEEWARLRTKSSMLDE